MTIKTLSQIKTEYGNGQKPASFDNFVDSLEAIIQKRGFLSVAVTTANVTLTSSQADNGCFTVTGLLTGNRSLIMPLTAGKQAVVMNSTTGSYSLTVIGPTGNGVDIGQGKTALLFCDGTHWYRVTADFAPYERHLQTPISAALITGTSDGTYATVIAGKIINQNSDALYLQQELFADWDGGNVYLEIDWLPTTQINTGQTVIWIFSWKAVAEGEDADTGTAASSTVTYTAPGNISPGTMIHSRCTMAYNDANQPLTANDHLYIKLYRDATTDTFSGDCLGTAFEFIYTSTGLPVG